MPFAARRDSIVLTLLLPLLAVAALEILWYFSQHSTSSVNTNGNSSTSAYAIRYSCTIIALAIATLLNNLDFAIAVMTPYNALRAGNARPERSVLFSVIGDLSSIEAYKAIHQRHVGAALSITASTIGSTLTIIVSGVWISDNLVATSKPMTAEIGTTWDFIFKAGADGDNGAATVFNVIKHGGVDNSSLIWQKYILAATIENLILDKDSFSKFTSKLDGNFPQYDFQVPTVYPCLDYNILLQSMLCVNQTISNRPGDLAANILNDFYVEVELPADCTVGSVSGPQNVSFGQ